MAGLVTGTRAVGHRLVATGKLFASRPPAAQGARVFVAARSSDAAHVLAFSEALGPRDTWTAVRQESIAGGWQVDAAAKIRAANAVVLLVTADTAESHPIGWELRLAAALGKPVIAHRSSDLHPWPADLSDRAVRVTSAFDEFAERFDVLAIQAGLAIRREDAPVALLLEQYKLILESAERLEDRRQTLHAFFVSLTRCCWPA